MDERGWRLLTIILGASCFVLLIFTALFGFRLINANKVKQGEVNNNLKQQETTLKAAFQTEREKTLTTYTSDDTYGNFSFEYPKVWFTNVYKSGGSSPEFQFLADPSLILVEKGNYPASALKVQIFASSYKTKVDETRSQNNTDKKKLAEKEVTISGLKGIQFTGKIEKVKDRQVSFVILPLREKSIIIATDDISSYKNQFQKVLDSFSLSK